MKQRRAGNPGHQGCVLDGIPEPPAAPAEFVIGPVRAHGDAKGEEDPGNQSPGDLDYNLCKYCLLQSNMQYPIYLDQQEPGLIHKLRNKTVLCQDYLSQQCFPVEGLVSGHYI